MCEYDVSVDSGPFSVEVLLDERDSLLFLRREELFFWVIRRRTFRGSPRGDSIDIVLAQGFLIVRGLLRRF